MRRKYRVQSRDEEWRYRANLKRSRLPDPAFEIRDETMPALEREATEQMAETVRQLGLLWGEE